MKTQTTEFEIEKYIDRLLAILDKDVEHLENNISKLNELRSLVVKQDNDALTGLLENIRTESMAYRDNERNRQMVQCKLADLFDCPLEQLTLSRLEKELPLQRKSEIVVRKNKLRMLAGMLKKEHLSTQMLLADCARFNRLLLKRIFETGRSQNIMYKPTGTTERSTDNVFMNLQL